MRLSELRDFFDDKMPGNSLHDLIELEVQEYQDRKRIKGGSIPLTVTNDAEIIISARSISHLCLAFLSGDLTENDIGYVVEALLVSNFANDIQFVGDGLSDLVESLTDPDVNGPLSKERVLNVLVQLSLR